MTFRRASIFSIEIGEWKLAQSWPLAKHSCVVKRGSWQRAQR
jgi:hypothetical protein